MYSKLLAVGCLAALTVAAIGGGTFASASSSDDQTQTITAIEKTVLQKYVDLGPKGFSVGDEFVFAGQLWNQAQTQRIGSTHGYCVFVERNFVHCIGTARLYGNNLEVAGLVAGDQQTFTVAITGGTGSFHEAGGQLTIHNLNPAGTLSRDVFQITS
jgi:hypothetical protein